MKLDAALPPVHLKDVPAIAKAAEEIGFDALWTPRDIYENRGRVGGLSRGGRVADGRARG